MLSAIGDHGFLVNRGIRSCNDEGSAHLAKAIVGNPDDRHVGDPLQAGQGLFHLGGVDVESTADVHVLQSVGDPEVAGLVDGSDVAGVQPAFGVDGRGGGLRIVEVAEHDVGPP